MNKEIKELIKQHLPETTAGALKERLEALEIIEERYNEVVVDFEAMRKDRDNFEDKYNRLRHLRQQKDSIREGTKTLNMEQFKFGVEQKLFEERIAASELRVADHKEMMQTVFKNTEVRKTIYGGKDVPDHNGCYQREGYDHNETIAEE